MRYLNTGCWIQERLTYAVVDQRGARIEEYLPTAASFQADDNPADDLFDFSETVA